MQCARAILLSVACPSVQYFPTLPHQRHDFRENVIGHRICVLTAFTNFIGKFAILRRNERDTIKNYFGILVTYPLFLSDLKFLDRFSKNLQISNFIKLRPVGAELRCSMRTDRRTEMTKLIVAFRNFTNAPRIWYK